MDGRVWNEAAASVVPVGREDAAALLSHLLRVLPEGALSAKGYNKVPAPPPSYTQFSFARPFQVCLEGE